MYHDHGAGHNFMMMMITTLPVPHRSRPAKIRWLIHSESVWNSAGKCAVLPPYFFWEGVDMRMEMRREAGKQEPPSKSDW